MRMSWRNIALILVFGIWPHVGCHQLPGDKSVQGPTPIQQTAGTAKKQELTAADITQTAWLKQVETLEKARKISDAIALCETQRGPGNPNALQASKKIAFLYHQIDDLDKAELEYQALLKQNPKDADVLAKLGDVSYGRKHWGAAEKYYSDAVALRENHPSAWTGLGMTYAQLGDYGNSWKSFKRVVSESEAYCEVAFAMKLQGKPRDAIRAYEEALKLEPAMPRANTELANLRKTDLGPAPAIAVGRKAMVEPDNTPMPILEGTGRSTMQRPTVAPLPDFDWTPSPKK